MSEFWVSSGHHLLDRDADGRLVVTDDFLKVYFARPELMPPPEAGDAERALHASLLADPRRPVSPAEIAALDDEDARENWELMLAFRERLLAAPTLEGAYLALVRGDMGRTPPLFLNQLTQVILRNALDGCTDAHVLRAGELFFRTQRGNVHEGALLLADAEVVELAEEERSRAPLIAMFSDAPVVELDVLDEELAPFYFHRSDAHDTVLSLGGGARSRTGLARVMERWIAHLLGTAVTIEPLARIDDGDWGWFVGLDADATRIGNALWRDEDVEPEDLERIIGLFRLTFSEPSAALPEVGSRPVWLFLTLDANRMVRMKPHNLITGLPLRGATGAN